MFIGHLVIRRLDHFCGGRFDFFIFFLFLLLQVPGTCHYVSNTLRVPGTCNTQEINKKTTTEIR